MTSPQKTDTGSALEGRPNATSAPGVGLERLVGRFTSEQADLAAKISNDIAENIDCKETRKELRMAVAYFAALACEEMMARSSAESKLEILHVAKGLFEAAFPPNNQVRQPR